MMQQYGILDIEMRDDRVHIANLWRPNEKNGVLEVLPGDMYSTTGNGRYLYHGVKEMSCELSFGFMAEAEVLNFFALHDGITAVQRLTEIRSVGTAVATTRVQYLISFPE